MTVNQKTCTGCKKDQPLESFCQNLDSPDGHNWRCRTCMAAYHQKYLRERPNHQRARHLRARYGVSLNRYEEMLTEQGGGCAICRATPTGAEVFHVDHDHTCCPGGSACDACIRGLLCADCNRGLGCFKDNPTLLAAAIRYLA